MGRIQILDDALANQIAAGEVVERPASAAKELLENALDAGATAITVEIVDGGVRRLRVVDDGHGMSPEDAMLAVRRHATSKLQTSDQLSTIATLGFRGEALPSIAAVSRFRLRTRTPEAVGATVVSVAGGAAPVRSDGAGPVGTEILVEDLFFNIPARKKFLKKPATEASHVHEAVHRLALGAPGVAFRLIKDGKTAIELPRHRTLADRVAAVFGNKAARGLQPVDVDGAYGVRGLVGPPDTARATARHYYTFINGRYVRDRVIMAAVQSAYGQRLTRGRHPFVVLHLSLPPESVDVNVHPAKTEVRFADSRVIHRLVARAVDAALQAAPAPEASGPGRAYALDPAPTPGPGQSMVAHRQRIFDAMEALGKRRGPGLPRAVAPVHRRPAVAPPARPENLSLGLGPGTRPGPVPAPSPARLLYMPVEGPAALPLERLPVLGGLGPLLLLRAENAVIAVHVEAGRAQLAAQALAAGRPGAALEPPLTTRLDDKGVAAFAARQAALVAIGFEVEPFGGSTWAIKRAPAGLPSADAPALLADLLAAPDPDPDALRWRCARRIASGSPALAPAERVAFLRRLGGLEGTGGPRWIQAVTAAELGAGLG